MIVYRVFYKDFERKACRLLGELKERRRDLRGMTQIQAGLKWARLLFGECIRNRQDLVVVPREFPSEHGTFIEGGQGERSFVSMA